MNCKRTVFLQTLEEFSHVQIIERTLSLLISRHMEEKKVVIGIDLGMTTSCAFVPYNGRLENIVHECSRNTIDSVIKITPKGTCVLDVITTARAAQLKGKGCVYEAKRLIGRKYADVKEEVEKNDGHLKCLKAMMVMLPFA